MWFGWWLVLAAVLFGAFKFYTRFYVRLPNEPPYAVSPKGLFGVAQEYAEDPQALLTRAQKQSGSDVVTVDLILQKLTYILGPDAGAWYFGNEQRFSFEDAVNNAITHLFGYPPYGRTPGWDAIVNGVIAKGFQNQTALTRYMRMAGQQVHVTAAQWVDATANGKGMNLFPEASKLLTLMNIRALCGQAFAERHATELAATYYRVETLGFDPRVLVAPNLPFGPAAELHRNVQRLQALVEEEVKARDAAPDRYADATDYLQHVMTTTDKQWRSELPLHIQSILFAAHTNMTASFCWTLLEVLRDDAVRARVQAEIDALDVSSDLNDDLRSLTTALPFLQKCFHEAARLYGLVAVFRVAKEDVPYKGFVIPKGRNVFLNPRLNHHDSALFGADPHRFVPDRWTADLLAKSAADRTFVQWGFGRHVCRGMQYAQAILNRSFIELFRACDLALAEPDTQPGVDPHRFDQDYAKSIGTPFAKFPIYVKVKAKAHNTAGVTVKPPKPAADAEADAKAESK